MKVEFISIIPSFGAIVLLTISLIYSFLKGKQCKFSGNIWVYVMLLFSCFIMVSRSSDLNSVGFFQMIVLVFSISTLFFIGFMSNKIVSKNFEYLIIFMFAVTTLLLLVSSRDLFTIFLLIEMHNLCMFALLILHKDKMLAIESSIKYLFLGGFATIFYGFGMVLMYGVTGTLSLIDLKYYLPFLDSNYLISVASTCILLSLFVKMGVAPFHFWVADVYQGAPIFISAYMSTILKFVYLIVVGCMFDVFGNFLPMNFILNLSILSIVVGALAAVTQRNFLRFMAYSGVNNLGYILILFYSAKFETAFALSLLYMIIYVTAVFGLFINFAIVVKNSTVEVNMQNSLDNLIGYSRSNPILAISIAINVFSLIGLPPFAGFFVKYFVIYSISDVSIQYLLGILFVVFQLATFYYLRIIKLVYFDDSNYRIGRHYNEKYIFSVCFLAIFSALMALVFSFYILALLDFFNCIVKIYFL